MFSSGRGGRDDLPPAPIYNATTAKSGLRAASSVIGQDVTITGNVSCSTDLQIDGRIDGEVWRDNLGEKRVNQDEN